MPIASRNDLGGLDRWWRRLPRPVLVAVVAAWAVRAVLLCYSAPVSDEYLALRAASAPVVAKFFAADDAAARWRIVRDLTTGDRPLWAVSHLLWGRVLPSNGGAAYALSLAAALLAALALAAAARRILGRDEAALVLVLASFSPLLLYYAASVMALALCAMWVCLALFFLASPAWRTWEWAAGGLCLGVAFGTHMAAGAPALGLALALGISAVRAARDRSLAARERVRRSVALPLAGAAAAAAPLGGIAIWARGAGDSYLGRLVHHENFGFADLGPRGLWLRQLLELDPMIEVILVVVACAAIFGTARRRGLRIAAAAGAAVGAGVLALSLRAAPWRAPVSLAAFAALGVAAGLAGVFGPGTAGTGTAGDTGPRDRSTALTPRTLATGAALIAVLFTVWRPVSAMPRLVFPSWPLFVLVLVGCARAALAAPVRRWVAPVAGLGCVLLALGVYSMVRLRSVPARADAAAAAHPGWRRLRFEDLWKFDDRMRAGGWLATRAAFDVEVVRGAPDLDPICTYEEEPYKIAFMAEMVRDFGLGGVLTAHEIPWAEILFDPGPTARP